MKSSSRSKGRVITVKVTQKNINTATKILSSNLAGQPARCTACPVAQAFLDTKKFGGVSVFPTFAVLSSKRGKEYIVWFASKVARFIDRYDDNQVVKPFQFTARLLAN